MGKVFARAPLPVGGQRFRFCSNGRSKLPCASVCGKRGDKTKATLKSEAPVHDQSKFDVYAVSDLHTDYEVNRDWVDNVCEEKYQNDVLIVAGDISDDLRVFRDTLEKLTEKFKHVAFVPGNHELWVRGPPEDSLARNGNAKDSMEKLSIILDVCQELGVIINPTKIEPLWVVPILSWHHRSFDIEPDIPNVPRATRLTVSDYRCCKWPELNGEIPGHGSELLAEHLDSLNDASWTKSAEGCDIITFSHFLPRPELMPEKRYLFYPNIAKAIGSIPLCKRLNTIQPNIHVFGHSHFSWDAVLDDGIRYVQCPLCYPGERVKRTRSISMHSSFVGRYTKSLYRDVAESADWLPTLIYSTHAHPGENSSMDSETEMDGRGVALSRKELVDVIDTRESPSSSGANGSVPLMVPKKSSRRFASVPPIDTNGMANQEREEVGVSGRPQVRIPTWSDWLNGLNGWRSPQQTVKQQAAEGKHAKHPRPLNGVMHTWRAAWSDYYKTRARDPNNKELASWVSESWRRRNKKNLEKTKKEKENRGKNKMKQDGDTNG